VHHAQSKENNQSQVRNQSQEGARQEEGGCREEARQEGRREEGQDRREGIHEELPRDVDARLRLLLNVQRGFDPQEDKEGDP
jgi:hypothetical protein